MRFEPELNQYYTIGDGVYEPAVLPASLNGLPMAYGEEGGKSTVYQLTRDADRYALKVFKPQFQGRYVLDNARGLDRARYAELPGMKACKREVLTEERHGELVRKYRDLKFAVLMPWIPGDTWRKFVGEGAQLSIDQSLMLAKSTAEVLSTLEVRGLAHCDIACGNVLLDLRDLSVGLVDLEDLYSRDLPRPKSLVAGTDGYQHRFSRSEPEKHWGATADRFSGAILLAEIVSWHVPQVRKHAFADQSKPERKPEHYFDNGEMHEAESRRYQVMLAAHRNLSVELADLFEEAWQSKTLADCPRLEQWADAIIRLTQTRDRVSEQLRTALAAKRIDQVVQIVLEQRALLDLAHDFELPDQQRIAQANRHYGALREAIQAGDELKIAERYGAILERGWAGELGAEELQAVEAAQRSLILDVQDFVASGEEALGRGDITRAIVLSKRALEEDPDSLEAQLLQERARARREEVQGIIEELEKALEGGSDRQIVEIWEKDAELLADSPETLEYQPRYYEAQAACQALEQLRDALSARRVDRTATVYTEHRSRLVSSPDLTPAEEAQAKAAVGLYHALQEAIEQDDGERVAELYATLKEEWPGGLEPEEQKRVREIARWSDSRVMVLIADGQAALQAGELPSAIALLEQALDQNRENAQAQQLLEEARERQKVTQQALWELEQAVASDRDRQILDTWWKNVSLLEKLPQMHQYRARVAKANSVCWALDRLQEALASGQVAAVARVYWEQRALLGTSRDLTASDRDRAEQALEMYSALWQGIRQRDDARVVELAADIQEAWPGGLGSWEQAQVEGAARRRQRILQAHIVAGEVALDKKDLPTAMAEFGHALEIDPGNKRARHSLAKAREAQGRRDGALSLRLAGLLERVKLALSGLVAPFKARRLVTDAQAALDKRDLYRADALLKDALALAPNSRRARQLRARVRKKKRKDPRFRYYVPAIKGWLPQGRSVLQSLQAPYVLEVVYGARPGIWYPVFPGARLTVGRGKHSDVPLPDQSTSREHALLTCEHLRCRIQDLGSMNMTFVNGEPVSAIHDVRPGDHLRFGNTVLRLDAAVLTTNKRKR